MTAETAELLGQRQEQYEAISIPRKSFTRAKTICSCECDCACERGVPIITSLHLHSPSHQASLSPKSFTAATTASNYSLVLVVIMTFMTLFMSVVGAGMLSIPYLFATTPTPIVLGCLALVGLAMGYTAELLVRVYIATNESTFNGLAHAAFGPMVSKIVSATTIFAILGACVGCLEIVRDLSPFMLQLMGIQTNRDPATIVLTVFIMCIYPLTLLKKLTALRFSSYVGFVASIYLVLAVTLRSQPASTNSVATTYSNAGLKISHVISVFNYAFVSHLNVIPLFVNLEHSMAGRQSPLALRSSPLGLMQGVIYAMSLFCIGMYCVFGLNAISLYGDKTNGNILLNLENDHVMEFPRIAVLVTILFSFPLLFHPFMMLVESFVLQLTGYESLQLSPSAKALESLVLLLFVVFVATVMPGIQVTFSLTGASCVTIICYVFPVLCYLRLCPTDSLARRAIAMLICVMGVMTGLVATIMVITGTIL